VFTGKPGWDPKIPLKFPLPLLNHGAFKATFGEKGILRGIKKLGKSGKHKGAPKL